MVAYFLHDYEERTKDDEADGGRRGSKSQGDNLVLVHPTASCNVVLCTTRCRAVNGPLLCGRTIPDTIGANGTGAFLSC